MIPTTQSVEDFLSLLRDELGLQLDESSLGTDFDALPDWDSLHLLKLVTSLERATGRRIAVGQLLEVRSLREVYELAGRP
ncbi:acyl carrier protein [Streptomyces sp. NPDC047042]|uniref:acyl carrier protein n=1 Tax=Streptomyces sp. NPDC047042 TaxID=3154807 RepID=UPI003401ED6D